MARWSRSYNRIMVFAPLDRFYPGGGVEPRLHITPDGKIETSWLHDVVYPTLGNYVKGTQSKQKVHGKTIRQVILNGNVPLENSKGYESAANGIVHPIKGYLGSNLCHLHSNQSEKCLLCTSKTNPCLRAACWYGFDRDQNRCNDKPWCREEVCQCSDDVCKNRKLRRSEINDLLPPLSMPGKTVGDVLVKIKDETGVTDKSRIIVNGVELTDLPEQKPLLEVRNVACNPQISDCNLVYVRLRLSRGNTPSECCTGVSPSRGGQRSPHLPLCNKVRATPNNHHFLMWFLYVFVSCSLVWRTVFMLRAGLSSTQCQRPSWRLCRRMLHVPRHGGLRSFSYTAQGSRTWQVLPVWFRVSL